MNGIKSGSNQRQDSSKYDGPDTIDVDIPIGSGTYNMSHDKRGLLVIFHCSEPAIEECCNELSSTLKNVGFISKRYKNLKLSQIEKVLCKLQKRNYENEDCIVVAVITKMVDGKFCAYDKTFSADVITSALTTNNCPGLVGKPKIFLLDGIGEGPRHGHILRSVNPQSRKPVSDTSRNGHLKSKTIYHQWSPKPWMLTKREKECEVDRIRRLPETADFFIFSGSEEAYRSYSLSKGSRFIKTFCKVMRIFYKTTSLLDMAIYVIRDTIALEKQFVQTPIFTSTLTRQMFFCKTKENKMENRLPPLSFLPLEAIYIKKGKALFFIHDKFGHRTKKNFQYADLESREFRIVLEDYGFSVEEYKNLTLEKIKNTLLNFLKRDFTEDQSVLVYINSHGDKKGKIHSYDAKYNRYEVITKPFLNNQKYYPTLVGKPKIFVFDACRGGRSMDGQYIALKRNQGPAPCPCKKVSYTERKINLNTWPKTSLNAEFLILSS
ncbi:hypothetical protein QYM36_019913 [Artemia franciscana]|uniref:Caspase family p20 domain-containing protein n=1 Tax=Artemia franciscana TaxID=6661 RepID=A0AA88H4N3_ARTSF|nr:hypothetical protein QYM36_019913 [Artemia franciscana]